MYLVFFGFLILATTSAFVAIQDWPVDKNGEIWIRVNDPAQQHYNKRLDPNRYRPLKDLWITFDGTTTNARVDITTLDSDFSANRLIPVFSTKRVEAVPAIKVIEQFVSGSTFTTILNASYEFHELRMEVYGEFTASIPQDEDKAVIEVAVCDREQGGPLDRQGDRVIEKSPSATPPTLQEQPHKPPALPIDPAKSGAVLAWAHLDLTVLTVLAVVFLYGANV